MLKFREIKIVISLILLFSFIKSDIYSQVNYSDQIDESRLVYWFQIRITEIEDDSTTYVNLNITEVKRKLLHGTVYEYTKDLYKNLKNDIINVGPFYDFNEAWKAKTIYEHLISDYGDEHFDDSFIQEDSIFDENHEVYFFVLRYRQKAKKKGCFVRIPGAIASGAYYDFYRYLRDNLSDRILSIGPFLYMPEAEESKRIYRFRKVPSRKRFRKW